MKLKPNESVRSDNGRARIFCQPEWSISLPYITYRNGTAGRHFSSLYAAVRYLESLGYYFSETEYTD